MKHLILRSVTFFGLAAAAVLAGPTFAIDRPAGYWYGTRVQAANADRVIRIDPTTRWVNVTQNETVKFVVRTSSGREESFVWRFDGLTGMFDLRQAAPAGLLDREVDSYIAVDPRYSAP